METIEYPNGVIAEAKESDHNKTPRHRPAGARYPASFYTVTVPVHWVIHNPFKVGDLVRIGTGREVWRVTEAGKQYVSVERTSAGGKTIHRDFEFGRQLSKLVSARDLRFERSGTLSDAYTSRDATHSYTVKPAIDGWQLVVKRIGVPTEPRINEWHRTKTLAVRVAREFAKLDGYDPSKNGGASRYSKAHEIVYEPLIEARRNGK